MSKFRDRKTGREVFVMDNPRERLAARLNPAYTDAPSFEEHRAQLVDEALTRIYSDPTWKKLSARAELVLDRDAQYREQRAKYKADYRPDAYAKWEAAASDGHFAMLEQETAAFQADVAALTTKYKAPSARLPVTTADLAALQFNFTRLQNSTPAEAKLLVEDAVQRNDLPFLDAAGPAIRSWRGSKNLWASKEAEAISFELLDTIDKAAFTPEKEAAQHVAERAEGMTHAWSRTIGLVTSKEGYGDGTHRKLGALAPLLEATPEAQ